MKLSAFSTEAKGSVDGSPATIYLQTLAVLARRLFRWGGVCLTRWLFHFHDAIARKSSELLNEFRTLMNLDQVSGFRRSESKVCRNGVREAYLGSRTHVVGSTFAARGDSLFPQALSAREWRYDLHDSGLHSGDGKGGEMSISTARKWTTAGSQFFLNQRDDAFRDVSAQPGAALKVPRVGRGLGR